MKRSGLKTASRLCNRLPECPNEHAPNEHTNGPPNDDGRVQQNLQENDHPLGQENELRLERQQRAREWEQLWENGGPNCQLLENQLNILEDAYSGRTPRATRQYFKDMIREMMMVLPERGLERVVRDVRQYVELFM